MQLLKGVTCFAMTYLAFGIASCFPASALHAAILTFSTSDSQFISGSDNQGWWSPTLPNLASNDNYYVGTIQDGSLHNNFFSFNLASLNMAGNFLASATLNLTRFESYGTFPHNYKLFDVSTDVVTLNNTVGMSQTIYDDLGSGRSYGNFSVPTGALSTVLSFVLNANALSDINSAVGNWFSIGGMLDLTGKPNNPQAVFSVSSTSNGPGVQTLVLDVRPLQVTIPEPTSATIFVFFTIGIAMAGLKRSRVIKKTLPLSVL